MLKVGVSKVPYNNGEKVLDYHSVKYNIKGFADPNEYIPADCDLLHLLMADDRCKTGWWTGQCFYGLRLKPEDKVIGWKKSKDLN